MDEKLDAERAAYLAWYMETYQHRPVAFEGSSDYLAFVSGLRRGQARASLPVGVQDVLFDGFAVLSTLSDKAKARTSAENVSDVLDAVVKLLRAESAAPTVKAEQVDEATELALLREYRLSGIAFNDSQGEGYTVEQSIRAEQRMEAAEKACWDFYTGRRVAPSLPAAGSAELPYQDGIAEELERSDWTPIEALQWYAAGKHFDVVDGRTRIIDTGAVASNALKHASLDYLELKGDAELSELRAALSAQQSAPERVSVPVELLRRAVGLHGGSYDIEDAMIAGSQLRTLLANHGRPTAANEKGEV